MKSYMCEDKVPSFLGVTMDKRQWSPPALQPPGSRLGRYPRAGPDVTLRLYPRHTVTSATELPQLY